MYHTKFNSHGLCNHTVSNQSPIELNAKMSVILLICVGGGLYPVLTHISLASFLWDIGKQNSTRCEAAKRSVPSGAILFAVMNLIEK